MKQSDQILTALKRQGVSLSITIKGEGTKGLLVLPGIGMKSTLFESKLKVYEADYIIFYCTIQCDEVMDVSCFMQAWNKLLCCLADEYQLSEWNAFAYSIGSRWLFYSANCFKRVVLVAPDGVATHWVFRLVTHFCFFEGLFYLFSPIVLFFFRRNLKHFMLTIRQVFNQWKLLRGEMFPVFCYDELHVFLADNDRLVSSIDVVKKLSGKNVKELVIVKSTHFKLIINVFNRVSDIF